MTWEVSHAYWHYWQPGRQTSVAPELEKQYKRYCAKAGKRNSEHRLLLLALAMDAAPVDQTGECYTAYCWTPQETLAERLQRSKRTVQRLLTELQYWQELEAVPCDGRCRMKVSRHFGTYHYYLPLPEGAQPWGRKARYELQKEAPARRGRRARQG